MSVTIANASVSKLAQASAPKTTATAPLPVAKAAAPQTATAKPLSALTLAAPAFMAADTALSLRPVETTFSAASATASITLSKAYPAYEMAGDTGRKSIAEANSVNETVTLKKGVTYTLNSAFGLNNIKGSVKLDIRDANGTALKSTTSAVGKTNASITFTPTSDGTYSIFLTGQAIAKTKTAPASTTNLYNSYQIQVTQALAKLPKKSGNTNVDALVLGGTNAWQHALGSSATPSDQVINGSLKSLNNVVDNNNVIYYSFMDSSFISHMTGADAQNASAMDDATKNAVATAFDYLSSLVNVKFSETSNASNANIVLGENAQGGVSAGYANPPNQSGSHSQYLFLANDAATNDATKNDGFATGSYGWQTLVHEIAHTMGLKHPFNGNAGGGSTPGPYLPTSTNNQRYTVMSYTSATDSKTLKLNVSDSGTSISQTSINPSTYMAYDIAALQYLYGANTSVTSTDTKLASVQTLDFSDNYKGMETLWTPNGGTLDASATTRQNVIDLRGGAYSSINYLGTGAAQFTNQLNTAGITNSTAVAAQVKYFNAAITATYTGKNNVALAYGSKITEAKGGAADDSFYVSNYNSALIGGNGNDTVYLTGSAKDWVASDNTSQQAKGGTLSSSITLTNKTTHAQISLSSIEKYAFYQAGSAMTKA